MALGDEVQGSAEVLEWADIFMQTGAAGVIEGSFTSMVSEVLHLSGQWEQALHVSAMGEQRAQAGEVRVMVPEIFRTRGRILSELGRLDDAAQAYRSAVASARAQGALSFELRALTSLLKMQLANAKIDAATVAELRTALAGMVCDAGRPDLVSARKALAEAAI